MLWVETTTEAETQALHDAIWRVKWVDGPGGEFTGTVAGPMQENGRFWFEELTRVKADNDARYAIARRHLPLPAAWREMAISLRNRIRKARKEKIDYEGELRELHRLAAMSSYAGFGIIERVPYARLSQLDLSYQRIG